MHHRVIIGVVGIALAAASPADAQQGRADLQYRAPMPAAITYVSVDTAVMRISGLPTGDMTSSSHFRSVSSVSFAPADIGMLATVALKELQGSTSTPMGDMPISASDTEPVSFRITATGPVPDDLAEYTPAAGASPSDLMGGAKAFAFLLQLPGRELKLGESWTDTTSMAPEIEEGLTVEVTTITRGTYAADSTVNGVTLNVLKVVTDTRMTMSGTAEGMAITQEMTTTGDDTVLWDPARHYLVSKDGTGTIRSETVLTDMGMTMVMTGETRAIIRAEIE
jgi:hypothetical protein